jgi:hypothetical protein
MSFDPWNRSLQIRESIETPTPKLGAHLGVWRFIPSRSLTLPGAWNVILGLHYWAAPLQALASVASPKLELQHKRFSISLQIYLILFGHNLTSMNIIYKVEGEECGPKQSMIVFLLWGGKHVYVFILGEWLPNVPKTLVMGQSMWALPQSERVEQLLCGWPPDFIVLMCSHQFPNMFSKFLIYSSTCSP